MRNRINVLVLLVVCLLFICTFCTTVWAEDDTVNTNLADLRLDDEVISICNNNFLAITEAFDIYRTMGEPKILGNNNDEPVAILFLLKDEENEDGGYIVFDYSTLSIKEFDFSGNENLFNYLSLVAKEKEEKIIYDGELSIKDSNSFCRKRITIRNNLISTTSQTGSISSPSSYKEYALPITTYSSSIKTRFSDYSFVTTSNYTGYSNHCAPTAATNIAILMQCTLDSNYPYNSTFKKFYSKMHTNVLKEGTLITDVRIALTTYLSSYSTNKYNLDFITSVTSDKIKVAVSTRNPFYVSLQSNSYYGNHGVVGIGWYRIVDDNGVDDFFIRVLDGWTQSTYRYVAYDSTVSSIIKIKNK